MKTHSWRLISKQASFHKTCRNRYDAIIYNANWKSEKVLMRLQRMKTVWLAQPSQVTLKDTFQQDNLLN